jgi:hypothetical protein
MAKASRNLLRLRIIKKKELRHVLIGHLQKAKHMKIAGDKISTADLLKEASETFDEQP